MALLIGVKDGNDSAVEVYYQNTSPVTANAVSFQIDHGLNDANARLTSAYGVHANGWYPVVTVISRAANSLTVALSVPAPSGASLDVRVDRSI